MEDRGKGIWGKEEGGNVILKREGEKKIDKIKTKRQGATKIIWKIMRWREQDAAKEETNRKEKEQIHKNKKKAKEEGDVRDTRNR